MSRYITVDTINFTDVNGNSYPVKDVREIAKEPVSFEIDVKDGDTLDEVANRRDVFGEFGEVQAHRLFDANVVKLTENAFDVGKLKKLIVPAG